MISNVHVNSTARRKKEISRHASKRAQQRGIPTDAFPLIQAYGEPRFDGHGGIRYLMTEKAMAILERIVGHTQQLEKLAGCYVVLDAEQEQIAITVAHLDS